MLVPFLSFESINKQIRREMLAAFERVFDSGWYILGEEVENFEAAYAQYNQINYCVGVSNGLDALFLCLKTLNIGAGEEVIVPAHTFIATMLAVTHAGAIPVPVDVDEQTYNIDPAKIEEAITSRTKAILPVHLYGQPCNMEEIMSIAKKHNVFVIEDNAQSQGAKFNDRLTGCWGDVNATSFYPGKNLGALGDAGAITTADERLAIQAKILRNYGSAKKYCHEVAGYNMRLDECQAAFLSVKLKYLDEVIRQRQQIASMYNSVLKESNEIVLPHVHPKVSHAYHLYVIRTKQREQLQRYLKANGIGSLIHYPVAVHLQPAYAYLGYKKGSFPIAEEIADSCLSLPMWPGMKQDHVDQVGDVIKNFFQKNIL
jgi:dTDP-4-amino-4,6-dideoxygalactose transaminase